MQKNSNIREDIYVCRGKGSRPKQQVSAGRLAASKTQSNLAYSLQEG
jgi:hypothetical protein